MPEKFSIEFKKEVVRKCLDPTSNKTIKEIAEEAGVGYSSLQRWLRDTSQNHKIDESTSGSSEIWPTSKKLFIVSKAMNLIEPELGAFCREQGVYLHQINEWQKEFENMTKPADQIKIEREKNRQLKAKTKELEKELKRKDKALAEAAALLVLQKKVQSLFREEEES